MSSTTHAGSQGAGRTQPALCGARKTDHTGNCRRPAGWGTSHPGVGCCKWHAGSTPNGVAAARKEQARHALARLGVPSEGTTDPLLLLEQCLREAAGNVEALRGHVTALEPEVRADGAGIVDQRGPHPLVELYGQERDRLARIARECLAVGIEERHMTLEEAKASVISETIEEGLEALAGAGYLTGGDEALELFRRTFGRGLRRKLASGSGDATRGLPLIRA